VQALAQQHFYSQVLPKPFVERVFAKAPLCQRVATSRCAHTQKVDKVSIACFSDAGKLQSHINRQGRQERQGMKSKKNREFGCFGTHLFCPWRSWRTWRFKNSDFAILLFSDGLLKGSISELSPSYCPKPFDTIDLQLYADFFCPQKGGWGLYFGAICDRVMPRTVRQTYG